MAKSFLVTSSDDSLLIDKLHINVWLLEESVIKVETGFGVEVSKDKFLSDQDVSFSVHTPFDIASSTLEDLYGTMLKKGVLQLLFNDEVESKRPLSHGGSERAQYVEFHSERDGFLLLKPDLKVAGGSKNKVEIGLSKQNLRVDELKRYAGGSDRLSVYTRFRYKVDLGNTDNIHFERGVLKRNLLFDFRFNESRAFYGNAAASLRDRVGIRDIYIFVINPYQYTLSRVSSSNLKYVRFFEKGFSGWQKYIPDVEQYDEKYLIHYWRKSAEEEKLKNAYHQLISFETEKEDALTFFYKLSAGLVATMLFLLLPQYVDLQTVAGGWNLLSQTTALLVTVLKLAGSVIGTITAIVIANMVWDLVKSTGWYSALKNKVS